MALLVGALAAALTGWVSNGWHYAPAVGWIVAAGIYLAATWMVILPMDSAATEDHIRRRHEDGTPAISHMVVLVASIASLVGVGSRLGATDRGQRDVGAAVIGILSVIASWFAIHTAFTLRYAQLFYLGDASEPISFHQDRYRPAYKDFAYLAFTVGMTYQVSDTDLASPRMRGSVLGQALVSFLLGAIVLATTINLVLELAGH